jgi:hypothetical protein
MIVNIGRGKYADLVPLVLIANEFHQVGGVRVGLQLQERRHKEEP